MYFSSPYLVTYQNMVFKTNAIAIAILTILAMLIISYKLSYLGKWF